MYRLLLAFVLLGLAAAPAAAWNDKGHMVIARLAWKELTPGERAKLVAYLSRHPHVEEYLKKDRPDNIPEEEWVFLRAGTWSDWIRGGPAERRKFHQPTWHYINLPIIQAGSAVKPPPLPDQNIVKQITTSKDLVSLGGSQEQRAIHLCWLIHLVGDIHQPLHCVAFYGDTFPEGDRGGNRSLFRIDGRRVQMHALWDELLGTGVTLASLETAVADVEALMKEHAAVIEMDLKQHRTPQDWAHEGLATARRWAYRDGTLRPVNADLKPATETLPNVTEQYARDAGRAARLAAGKAGRRLADVLREVLAAN